MNEQNNFERELTDEELMTMTGGLSYINIIQSIGRVLPLYGIGPIALYGIRPLYGISVSLD